MVIGGACGLSGLYPRWREPWGAAGGAVAWAPLGGGAGVLCVPRPFPHGSWFAKPPSPLRQAMSDP